MQGFTRCVPVHSLLRLAAGRQKLGTYFKELNVGVMKKMDTEFLYWMKGAMELYDDLPDGAWWAVGEETVELFNREHGTNWDSHDGFSYYCEHANNL